MACGTPVVTYLTGGSPEAVSPDTGLVINQGDISALVSAVEKLCHEGKAHYSAACRQRAIEHYNKEDRYRDYIKVYQDILR